MLIKRILTAMILIPLTLAGIFYLPPLWFCIVTGVISLGAVWEWSHLMQLKSMKGRIFYLVLSAIVFVWILSLPVPLVFAFTFIWWLIATLLIIFYPRKIDWWKNSTLIRGMMGMFVLGPCFAAVNFIRNQAEGIYTLLFLLILVFGADTTAYFAGKKWGKTKLAPLVSPGKTKEGFFAALIFSILFATATLWFLRMPLLIWPWIILLSVFVVAFSIAGDLFESMMKREAGVKDSGNILPGHGGLLDRIDSVTAAAPVFVFGELLLGYFL